MGMWVHFLFKILNILYTSIVLTVVNFNFIRTDYLSVIVYKVYNVPMKIISLLGIVFFLKHVLYNLHCTIRLFVKYN